MSLAEICIRRPILASVISLSILLLGILGFSQLNLMFKPSVFEPSVQVQVTQDGASSEYMDNSITTPLETQLQSFKLTNSVEQFHFPMMIISCQTRGSTSSGEDQNFLYFQ